MRLIPSSKTNGNHEFLRTSVIILVLSFMLALSAAFPGRAYAAEKITWEYNSSTKTLTFSGTGAMDDILPEVPQPWSSYCGKAETIVISDGISRVGDNAFAHFSCVKKILLPDSVTSIGEAAFYSCSAMESITIPDGVKKLDDKLFLYCDKLETVFLPKTINRICDESFLGCENLSDVYFQGTALQWSSMMKGDRNDDLDHATIWVYE